MANLSINETTTLRWSLEEDVQAYADVGITHIGLWRQKLSDVGLDRAEELLAEYAIRPSHLFWAGGFTGSEGRPFAESVADALDALQAAKRLGAPVLVLHSGARNGHTINHAWKLFQSAVARLLPLARRYGVTLAIEPRMPACLGNFTFLDGLDAALEFVHGFESDYVKIVFDAYYLGFEQNIVQRIAQAAKHTALVQLADAKAPPVSAEEHRCRLGDGVLPIQEIVDAFLAAGYDGCFDLELWGREFEGKAYAGVLQHAAEVAAALSGTTNIEAASDASS